MRFLGVGCGAEFVFTCACVAASRLFLPSEYFAVGYLPDPACDDALDSDPVDPEFVAFPPEFVEPEPELFVLLEFEFVLSLEVWPEPEPLEDELLLPLAELEFSDPEFVLLEFVPDSVVDEELEALCVEFC